MLKFERYGQQFVLNAHLEPATEDLGMTLDDNTNKSTVVVGSCK